MRWIALLLYFVIFLMCWGALEELHLAGGGLTILMLMSVLTFLAVAVHELGHAIAARRVEARVITIVALPFELRLRPVRLRLARRRQHRDIGGYVLYEPPKGMTRRQAMFVAAAGPLANFLSAPAVLLLAFVAAAWLNALGAPAPRNPTSSLPADAEVLAAIHLAFYRWAGHVSQLVGEALAVLSVGMGAANLIPFNGSDGASVLQLWRAGEAA